MISRSIVVPPETISLYAYPRIGYHSVLPGATLTASSSDSNHPVSLVSNYLTYDAWEATASGYQWIEIETASAEVVDYVGIACHNLNSANAPFRVQYYSDTGWTDAMDDFMPMFNSPFLFEFDPVISNRFRFQVLDSNITPFVGIIFIGQIMHFERGVFVGHAPAPYSKMDTVLNSESEGGQFLGRSMISEGAGTTIDLDHLSSDYLRSTWVPFQEHAVLRPFFFTWNPVWYPYEVIYGWSTGEPKPTVGGFYWYKVAIPMKGIVGHIEDET